MKLGRSSSDRLAAWRRQDRDRLVRRGVRVLGEDINARYPPLDQNQHRAEPDRRTLYVGHQGAGVRVYAGRVEVHRQDSVLLSVPSGHVERIVLSGSVGLSTGARSWALATGVDVVLLSRHGSYLGALEGPNLPNVRASATAVPPERRQRRQAAPGQAAGVRQADEPAGAAHALRPPGTPRRRSPRSPTSSICSGAGSTRQRRSMN